MGSSTMPSIIGIERCGSAYWGVQVGFILFCFLFTFIAIRLARRDQALKLKYGGINVAPSDIRYNDGKQLAKLITINFFGGFGAGALGLGGSTIYNPAMLAMGVPPRVSSATGLHLVTFSKIASTVVYVINDQLDIYYGLWIGLFSIIGSLGSLLVMQYYMKKTGRQSVIVWSLTLIFLISFTVVPIFSGLSLKTSYD